MASPLKSKFLWTIIVLGGIALLIVLFYAEEDWRGKHDWEKYKRQLEAKGYVLDWNKLIPPPIPDDENIFKAPKMQEWFVGRGASELTQRLQSENQNLTTSTGPTNLISTPELARKYLAWSDQFEPDFNLIREALKRPYARMDGNYSVAYDLPIPNFITIRAVAQVSAQRAHCYMLLNQPDRALDELTLMHDLRGVMQPPPSGKPETLVAAMINVAVAGLYANVVEEGFQKNVWQEAQLVSLQRQLAAVNVMTFVFEALQTEPVAECRDTEIGNVLRFGSSKNEKLSTRLRNRIRDWLWPRGWTYQNMVSMVWVDEEHLKGFDPTNQIVQPQVIQNASDEITKFVSRKSPFRLLAAVAIPNIQKANQTTARNQTILNEAQIACALERYRLANGNYPETLDALAPQFMDKIPHDIINGGQLIYRRTNDGKFLLYSVGWNEKDDGGVDDGTDFTKGDWVWKN